MEDKEARKVTACVSRGWSLRDKRRNGLPGDSADNQQRARRPPDPNTNIGPNCHMRGGKLSL